MKTSLKAASYGLLSLSLLWASCKKHDGGTGTGPTGGTEFLSKVTSADLADSVFFFYNGNQLRAFSHDFTVNSVVETNAFFPVYVGSVISALNEGPDTSGTNAQMYYNFLLDGKNRIMIASAQQIAQPYYDSLVYDPSSGRLSLVYTFLGSPAGGAVLDFVTQLTWDAGGDVTQEYVGDSLQDISTNYVYSAALTYDSQTNPYAETGASLLLSLLQNDYYSFLSAHNIATAAITENGGSGNASTENDVYTYTYDAAGNPLTLSFAATVQGSTATANSSYAYVKL